MPEQRNIPVFRPGAGDVSNGSVDYYSMDWEIVGREDQPAAGRARSGCGCTRCRRPRVIFLSTRMRIFLTSPAPIPRTTGKFSEAAD